MRPWFILLIPVPLLCGCGPSQPPSVGPTAPKLTLEQWEVRFKEDYAIVYVILPRTKESEKSEFTDDLWEEFKPFLDAQENTRLDRTGTRRFLRMRVAPVKDVVNFATRQTLGTVLAYDPDKRTLLLEYGAPASARDSWKDATYLDRQVMARSAHWNNLAPIGYKEEEIVYVRLHGDWAGKSGMAQEKLEALLDGPPEQRVVMSLSGSPSDGGNYSTTMAPVKDLDALAKKIDFAEVILHDSQNHALILGPPKAK